MIQNELCPCDLCTFHAYVVSFLVYYYSHYFFLSPRLVDHFGYFSLSTSGSTSGVSSKSASKPPSEAGETKPQPVEVASSSSSSGPRSSSIKTDEASTLDLAFSESEPGPATVKREAAILDGLSAEEAVKKYPKFILERNVPSAADEGKTGGSGNCDKKGKSRILSALLQDECKYLKDMGLGNLLSTEQRLTRHSELKTDETANGDASRPRKRKRTSMPARTSLKSNAPSENGVKDSSRPSAVREVRKEQRARMSLPSVNTAAVTVDENKNVASVAKKRRVDEAVVGTEGEHKRPNGVVVKQAVKRVVTEKEPKVNGVSSIHCFAYSKYEVFSHFLPNCSHLFKTITWMS